MSKGFIFRAYFLIYTTISHWSPINPGAKISVFYTRLIISKNVDTLYFGFGCKGAVCLKKKHQKPRFLVEIHLETWTLINQKSVFCTIFFVFFFNLIQKDEFLLVLKNQILTHFLPSFHSILGHKISSLVWKENLKKGVSCPPTIFLMIFNKTFILISVNSLCVSLCWQHNSEYHFNKVLKDKQQAVVNAFFLWFLQHW